jgi:hypothetical protein
VAFTPYRLVREMPEWRKLLAILIAARPCPAQAIRRPCPAFGLPYPASAPRRPRPAFGPLYPASPRRGRPASSLAVFSMLFLLVLVAPMIYYVVATNRSAQGAA